MHLKILNAQLTIFLFIITEVYSLNFDGGEDDCEIFCSGKILHYMQMSRIFKDSKYFVDMKLKYPSKEVLEKFFILLNDTKNKPDKADLIQFVEENFDPPGSELDLWEPDDWQERPSFIDRVHDLNLQKWLLELNEVWKNLGRKVNDGVLYNQSLYSQIFVPYPFIIPGGRFREFYYWDSFWIIDGLLVSEMKNSAKYMLQNYLYLVQKYGYVPNGGRKYFVGRSQPPLLILMVNLYWEATGDQSFLKENIITLEKEFNFWLNNRTVYIKKHGTHYQVFQYNVYSKNPRAESYYEDMNHAVMINSSNKALFFSSVKSAAESGWDFSSRWFITHGKRSNNFLDINTEFIIPVCLNSIMGKNAYVLSKFFKLLGDNEKFTKYSTIAHSINETLSRIFWNDDQGIWLDYNKNSSKHIDGFYVSNLMPLWAELYGVEYEKHYIIKRVLEYIKKLNITSYEGGVPTSLKNSSQQWDYPDGWAPLQYFIIMGLRSAGNFNLEAGKLAFELTQKWILNCYITYFKATPPAMFEKYDVTHLGNPGGGGEYENQVGFGWSNGVAIKLIHIYANEIKISSSASIIIDPVSLIIGLVLVIVSIISLVSYIFRAKYPSVKKVNKQRAIEAETFL